VRRKVSRDIFLAHDLSERTVDELRGPPPTRLVPGLAAQLPVAEIKPRLGESLREIRRGLVDKVERRPGLQCFNARVGEDCRNLRKGRFLTYNDAAGLAQLRGPKPCRPCKAGRERV